VHTDLQARSVRETGGWTQRFFHATVQRFGMSPARGALSLLRAATDPNAEGGAFYAPRFQSWGAPVKRPLFRGTRKEDLTTLWEVSERETGITFEVAKPS
jgi:hypothetical protein